MSVLDISKVNSRIENKKTTVTVYEDRGDYENIIIQFQYNKRCKEWRTSQTCSTPSELEGFKEIFRCYKIALDLISVLDYQAK